jgi:peptidyl-prolyl cis-trans isomerase A (cyclophilin A)
MQRSRVVAAVVAVACILIVTACNEKPAPRTESSTQKTETLPDKATAVLETSMGTMHCELFPKVAPKNVMNFIGLAEGTKEWKHPINGRTVHFHLYDGTVFHRVIPGFMVQGGDPAGNGAGSPGYYLPDEIKDVTFDRPGRMALANDGRDRNGSQFFITETPQPSLNGKFTIIGQCDPESVAIVKKMARVPRDKGNNDRPFDPPKLIKVTIEKQ